MYKARMQLRMTEEMKAAIDARGNGQEFVRGAIEAALRGSVRPVARKAAVSGPGSGKVSKAPVEASEGFSVNASVLLAHVRKKGRCSRRAVRSDLGWVDADLGPAILELKEAGVLGVSPDEVWIL